MTVATSFKIAVVPAVVGVSALKLEMQADPKVKEGKRQKIARKSKEFVLSPFGTLWRGAVKGGTKVTEKIFKNKDDDDDQLQNSMNQCTMRIDAHEHARRLAKAQAIEARNLKLAEFIAPIIYMNRSKFHQINNSTYDKVQEYMPVATAFIHQDIDSKPFQDALVKAMLGADDVYRWFLKAYKENKF